MRDYLHFLHIALGSLSETQYFIHLACRLGYLDDEQAGALMAQTRATFARLHGLIRAVEKEVRGPLSVVRSPLSVVHGLCHSAFRTPHSAFRICWAPHSLGSSLVTRHSSLVLSVVRSP